MLTDRSMEQTVRKLERLEAGIREKIFVKVGQARVTGFYGTEEPLHRIPDRHLFGPVPDTWGGEGRYGWFLMEYTAGPELEGRALYLYPHIGSYESTLWVNGRIHSNYAAKFNEGSHGNHWCNRFTASAGAGESFEFALEGYAWHDVPGTAPLTEEAMTSYMYPVGGVDVCVRDELLFPFCFDLRTLLSLRRALPSDSFRRAQVDNALYRAHLSLLYDPSACSDEAFREGIRKAGESLKEALEAHNGDSAPFIGLTGHSHMDTAWLWPMTETEKKCARTYANSLNLMEEYPEYRFIQSSAFHSDWLRRDYPELFERIREKVREGRYEPNGGVWVECDCNVTGGEWLVRQFVWGQRFTGKYFGFRADCFWLPDTFGYSRAIPQIMKGCGIRYFLTTKLAWNDTNDFPLTTFLWEGLDGTRVMTHFNRTHTGPTPESFHEETLGSQAIREKRVSPMRLLSFGRGDGGGGPEFEMLESARRLQDLDGAARSGYMSVSEFMHRLEAEAKDPTVYAGELYLEAHRGTLTNQHEIKRNNRLCETALHTLELALVHRAVREGRAADGAAAEPLVGTLLVHQFHDILPGTCIHSVHEEARRAVGETIVQARRLTQEAVGAADGTRRVYNPLSFDREDVFYLQGAVPGLAGARTQVFTALDGREMTAVGGMRLPAFGSCDLVPAAPCAEGSPFLLDGNVLTTRFARVTFSGNGAISSFVDLRNGRELVDGLPFNTFLLAEDMPAEWDNWDVDADMEEKFREAGQLVSREVVSDGPVELRIRSVWRLGEKSVLRQDMVFDAFSPLVAFDTVLDWQEEHRFLKAAFDTAIRADGVRSEIQFGCIRRPNTRSTSQEKARFEVCNHKYSDLSELNGGVALLNDCKYGISVRGGSLRLSLHKGGMRPDRKGDKGVHAFRYALWPHTGGFGAGTVVQPAYRFNLPPVEAKKGMAWPSLVRTDTPEVLVETVKPCEDAQKAYILRAYESTGSCVRTRLTFSHEVKACFLCSMLEEEEEAVDPGEGIWFTPFAIRTIKVVYG